MEGNFEERNLNDRPCEAITGSLQAKKANGETSPTLCTKPACRFCTDTIKKYFDTSCIGKNFSTEK